MSRPLLTPNAVLQNHHALTKHPPVECMSIDEAKKVISSEKDRPVILCLGTDWSLLARTTMRNLNTATSQQTERVLFIDQEQARDFCDQHGIVPGQPVVMRFVKGQAQLVPLDKQRDEASYTDSYTLPVSLASVPAASQFLSTFAVMTNHNP